MGPSGPTVSEWSSLATGMPASVVVGLGCGVLMHVLLFKTSPGLRCPDDGGGRASAVAGVERQERQACRQAGGQLDQQVDPERRPGEQASGGAAEGDRRIEDAAGDAADGERASGDGEPDRQAEKAVVRLVLAGG